MFSNTEDKGECWQCKAKWKQKTKLMIPMIPVLWKGFVGSDNSYRWWAASFPPGFVWASWLHFLIESSRGPFRWWEGRDPGRFSHVPQPAKGCDLTLGCVPLGPLVLRMKERHQIVHSHDPKYWGGRKRLFLPYAFQYFPLLFLELALVTFIIKEHI